ncbi:bikaverin cluster-monooxygenase [Aspergillus terreus]|uniref:Bikaverin cluster-monooxygenase n=1 Tax=Aspergillus terreus TaxID=33178 RepID=A0A5M3ZDY5_ASPTE|nr:hypothetical protein ATETN484_0017006800 [Aspergillus terreus]GFF21739.1 bikaverin cluster-monooxygenase [Aspergillus terreus]
MSPAVTAPHYPIAVVGGGIAGLTLALALERQGVNYILFDAHESLSPDEGASIGLLPNGLRILDQLGLLGEIEKHTLPLQRWRHMDGEGNLLCESNALGYYPSKLGYGGMFLPRRKVLEIMANSLKSHETVRTGTRVLSLEETDDNVAISLSNGSHITADLVIGADGVRSSVREAIDRTHPGPPTHADDYMKARFACVYGISPPVKGIVEGECFSIYRPGATILIFTGQGATIFWFVFEDLGREYGLSSTPRYTRDDIDAVCRSVAHLSITPAVSFGGVYATRSVAVKVSLEEGIAPIWHTGRVVIVGDAAHKVSEEKLIDQVTATAKPVQSTPNAAMGANQAIESSTVLLNELRGVWSRSPQHGLFPPTALRAALERYSELRMLRASTVVQRAGMICRAQLGHDGPAAFTREELPSLMDWDWLFRGFTSFADSPALAGLPLSSKGEFYQDAVERFQKRVRARQTGAESISIAALFGMEP